MNRRTQILAGLAALGLVAALVALSTGGGTGVAKPLRTVTASSSPAAGAPAAGTRSGYDAFRLFHTRNVFDPDRRPPRVASSAATPPPATPPPARTDFVALTGTMLDANRSLAFFSGSRAEYNKVLSLRDRIAGAEITEITPASIEIDRAGQKTAGRRRPDRAHRRRRRAGRRARAGDLCRRAFHGVGRGHGLARRMRMPPLRLPLPPFLRVNRMRSGVAWKNAAARNKNERPPPPRLHAAADRRPHRTPAAAAGRTRPGARRRPAARRPAAPWSRTSPRCRWT